MKIKDLMFFVYKNLIKNKLKLILLSIQFIVITVFSIIILNSSLSYINNSNEIITKYYSEVDKSDKEVKIFTNYFFLSDSDKREEKLEKISNYIDYIDYNQYRANGYYLTNYRYIDKINLNLVENEDVNSNDFIYLKKDFKENYEKKNNIKLELNSYYDFNIKYYNINGEVNKNVKFKYCGYYENEFKDDLLFDYTYIDDILISSYTLYLNITRDNFDDCMKQVDSFVYEIKDFENDYINENKMNINFDYDLSTSPSDYQKFELYSYKSSIDTFNKTNLVNKYIMICAMIFIFIFIIISLLCIFTFINIVILESSYVMSIYKAYGIKKKDFVKIYLIEIFIIVFICSIISVLLSILLKNVFNNIIVFFLRRNYDIMIYYTNYKILSYYHFYVPITIFFIFIISILILYIFKLRKKYNSIRIDGGEVR